MLHEAIVVLRDECLTERMRSYGMSALWDENGFTGRVVLRDGVSGLTRQGKWYYGVSDFTR